MTRKLGDMVRAAQHGKDPLTPLLDKYFIERPHPAPFIPPEKPHVRAGGRFTPSSMGKCMRAAIFQYMQVPGKKRTTPEQELIFAVGDWQHYMMFSIFTHMEQVLGPGTFRVLGKERLVAVPSLLLAGWYDLYVEVYGVPKVLDVKTINDSGFTQLVNTNRPDPFNLRQLVRYLRALRVKHGNLVYLNKNDQRVKVFPVKFSQDVWKESVQWLRRAITYLEAKEVPPMHPECTKGSRMAKGCAFAHICYSDSKTPLKLRTLTYKNKPGHLDLWEETTGRHL